MLTNSILPATSLAADADISGASKLGNLLFDRLRDMRDADPIFYSEKTGGVWIVTGHRQVSEGFAGKKPLSAVRLPMQNVGAMSEADQRAKIPYMLETLPQWLINMDRPGQTRLRDLAMRAFSSKIAESMRPHVRQFIAEAFDAVADRQQFDMIEEVSRRIPGRTILKLLGLSEDHYPRLKEWGEALNEGIGGVNLPEAALVRCERALLDMRALFLEQIELRRAEPSEDFISALVTARDESGSRLSDEEMLGLLYVALIAGHDSTANTIALGTAVLAEAPDIREVMRSRPADIAATTMELMRYIAMSTLQSRVALEDFEWGGHHIRKGDFIFLMIAGANRDPDIFPNPDHYDAERAQTGNMVFGPGIHFCIGHWLAKVQVQEYFTALLERFDPELLDERLFFGRGLVFRGVTEMTMRFRNRP